MSEPLQILKIKDKQGNIYCYPLTSTKAIFDLEQNKTLDEILQTIGSASVKELNSNESGKGTNVTVQVEQVEGVIDNISVSESYAGPLTEVQTKNYKIINLDEYNLYGQLIDASMSKLDSNNVNKLITGEHVNSLIDYVNDKALATVNLLDSSIIGSDTNVALEIVLVDGKLVKANVSESYATVDNDLQVTDETQLVKGSDITKVKNYVTGYVSDYVNGLALLFTPVSDTTYPDISSYFETS